MISNENIDYEQTPIETCPLCGSNSLQVDRWTSLWNTISVNNTSNKALSLETGIAVDKIRALQRWKSDFSKKERDYATILAAELHTTADFLLSFDIRKSAITCDDCGAKIPWKSLLAYAKAETHTNHEKYFGTPTKAARSVLGMNGWQEEYAQWADKVSLTAEQGSGAQTIAIWLYKQARK